MNRKLEGDNDDPSDIRPILPQFAELQRRSDRIDGHSDDGATNNIHPAAGSSSASASDPVIGPQHEIAITATSGTPSRRRGDNSFLGLGKSKHVNTSPSTTMAGAGSCRPADEFGGQQSYLGHHSSADQQHLEQIILQQLRGLQPQHRTGTSNFQESITTTLSPPLAASLLPDSSIATAPLSTSSRSQTGMAARSSLTAAASARAGTGQTDSIEAGSASAAQLLAAQMGGNQRTAAAQAASASLEDIVIPHDFDILSGRGRRIQTNPGNVLLHQVVDLQRDLYNNAPRSERRDIAERIVRALNANGNRFLCRASVGATGLVPEGWKEISHDEAIEKVAHCFRSRRRI